MILLATEQPGPPRPGGQPRLSRGRRRLGGGLRRGDHRDGGRGPQAHPDLGDDAPHALRLRRGPAGPRARACAPTTGAFPCPVWPTPRPSWASPCWPGDELIGVLCIETDARYRFHEEDRACVEVLGGYLAIAIHNALLQERAEEPGERAAVPGAPPRARRPRRRPPPACRSPGTRRTSASSWTASTWCGACPREILRKLLVRAPRRRRRRVHQPPPAPGQVPGAAPGEGQPGEPADPAAPPSGGALPGDRAGPGGAGAVPTGIGGTGGAGRASLTPDRGCGNRQSASCSRPIPQDRSGRRRLTRSGPATRRQRPPGGPAAPPPPRCGCPPP